MPRHSHAESLDATLDGHDVCLEFDRVTVWSTDHHYGADADGNRGISRTEIDEDYAENILILTWEDSPDGHREITTPISALSSLLAAEVMRLIEEHIEKTEPTAPDEPEPDYDDVGD